MDKDINNNGYDYVDLELPSGTLWATCNVGANKPTDFGLYFQWGDTQGYTKEQVLKDKHFDWVDYKWNPSGDGKTFTKYTTTGATLELVDDAAHIHMGGSWHMPSPKQIKELLDNTTNIWMTQDGVNGRLFTSNKDGSKSIFIPVAGGALNGLIYLRTIEANVWSSMLNMDGVDYGQYFYFNLFNTRLYSTSRYCGFPVRGVIDNNNNNNLKKNKLCRLIQKLIHFTSVFKVLEK